MPAAEAPPLAQGQAAQVGALACRALRLEVEATPKPGLVDRRNQGAHRDMDLHTFQASAAALAPWFPAFHLAGAAYGRLPAAGLLGRLRPLGLACEQAMLRATGGVNTHKGSIFALGLLCGAAGRLGGARPGRARLCREAAWISAGLVASELAGNPRPATAGERLYQAHGLTGARGEAASGFATVRAHGLPAYERALAAERGEEAALLCALLHLLAVNADTNLVSRGGPAGLAWVQARAQGLLRAGTCASPELHARMADFDDDLIARNLSPGGSADLLAVTWFLSNFPDK